VKICAWLTPNDIRDFLARVEPDRALASAMSDTLYRDRSDKALVTYLDAHGLRIALNAAGFTAKLVDAVKERYGQSALETIIERPFEMVDRVKGVDFAKALALWRRLSPDKSDRRALARFAIAEKIRQKRNVGCASYPKTALTNEIRGQLLLSDQCVDDALNELLASGLLRSLDVHGQSHIAHRDSFEPESVIATQVQQRLGPRPKADPFDVLHAMSESGLASPDPGQTAAVEIACSNRLSLITGGPGTGKSSVLKAIASLARTSNADCRIKLVALAARVARAIGARTGIDADTIHAALGLQPGQAAAHGPHNPLPVDLIFVEEAFMIGNSLFAELLKAIPNQCQVVIVGDPEQLPPVMEGKPAEALMTSGVIPTARLTINHRSEARDIPIAGRRVMSGIQLSPSENVEIHREEGVEAALAIIKSRFEASILAGETAQILTAMHDGPLGTTSINKLISGREKIDVGDTVMQTVNDRERGFFNGELAIVVSIDGQGLIVQKDDGITIRCTPAQSRELVPAWAISFHKSQGLEYDTVILVVSRLHRHMLGQNLLNVGITRAKRRCLIIDHGGALKTLRGVNQTAKRATLLPHMLKPKSAA